LINILIGKVRGDQSTAAAAMQWRAITLAILPRSPLMFDPVFVAPFSATLTTFALIAGTILSIAPVLPVMFNANLRLGAAAATAQQLARLRVGVIPIGPTVLYSLINATAALASLNQDAARRGFGPPISLMKTEQALSGIEPILHCHKFAAVEFTQSVPISGSAHRPARTSWHL
jgi:hypothetical protein